MPDSKLENLITELENIKKKKICTGTEIIIKKISNFETVTCYFIT